MVIAAIMLVAGLVAAAAATGVDSSGLLLALSLAVRPPPGER